MGQSIQDLFRTSTGNAGLDLSSSICMVQTPKVGMQALPTGVYGPLSKGTVGLLLGRSCTIMKGFIVVPGVMDTDFEEKIRVMSLLLDLQTQN